MSEADVKIAKKYMECQKLDANLDIKRRLTWKEIMKNGSSES